MKSYVLLYRPEIKKPIDKYKNVGKEMVDQGKKFVEEKLSPEEENRRKLMALLKKHKIDPNPKLGSDFCLYLDAENNKKGVADFLKEGKDLTFDKLKSKYI